MQPVVPLKQNLLAFLKGYSVFLAASLLSLIMLLTDGTANIAMVVWPSLVLAGVLTTVSAQSFRFVLALALAVPSALAFGLQNVGWTLLASQMEITPVEDFGLVVIMTLPYCLGLCVLGGGIGMAIHVMRKNQLFDKLKPPMIKASTSRRDIKLLAKS